jgi:hypothetical protein
MNAQSSTTQHSSASKLRKGAEKMETLKEAKGKKGKTSLGLERMVRVANYRPKICELCGKSYNPISGKQKYCKKCAPPTSEIAAYSRFMARLFPNRSKEQKRHSYLLKLRDQTYRERQNSLRRERRSRIQKEWGVVGGPKGTWLNDSWEKAEEVALQILTDVGFQSPKRLRYFPNCPFDIRAERNGKICVFQVTMRTHIDDKKRHLQLAKDLGLDYIILYIKPDFSGYVLKPAEDSGADELTLADLREVKKCVENMYRIFNSHPYPASSNLGERATVD